MSQGRDIDPALQMMNLNYALDLDLTVKIF